MNLGIRAILYSARKWKKTLLVFFLLLAITTLVLFIQLLLSGIIQIALTGKSEYPEFFALGNCFLYGVFYYDSATPLIVEIFRLLFLLIAIIMPYYLGWLIYKRRDKNCK